ncbi:uncharacterized protein [Ptychodera flava]|uniref:uncharacterized protein n=1 Tax=Ptychodera flava TaxID=63121 RepID=UPI00396A70F9
MQRVRRFFGYSESSSDNSTPEAKESSDASSDSETEETEGSSRRPSMAMRLAISSFRRKFPNIKGASTELVHKWYKEGVGETTSKGRNQEATTGSDKRTFVIVDSRPDEEYKISHISGCVRIDFTIEDDANLIHLIDSAIKEDERHLPKTVVMYCSLGYRSCILADKLINALKRKVLEQAVLTISRYTTWRVVCLNGL